MRAGGLTGAVFNAAKEAALDAFLAKQIGFLDMARLVEETLQKFGSDAENAKQHMTLQDVLGYDRAARDYCAGRI